MKKIALLGLMIALAAPMMASACPKGTSPTGGTGSHHKGGHCVPR